MKMVLDMQSLNQGVLKEVSAYTYFIEIFAKEEL